MQGTRQRILLVDDEPDITSIMSVALKSAGFFVDVFNDPTKALLHFESTRSSNGNSDLTSKTTKKNKFYDLIISDIRMPGLNGFEFVRRVEAIDSEVKIMLITAYEIKKEEFDKVLPSLRIDALINKPISMTRLNDLVSALLIMPKEETTD